MAHDDGFLVVIKENGDDAALCFYIHGRSQPSLIQLVGFRGDGVITTAQRVSGDRDGLSHLDTCNALIDDIYGVTRKSVLNALQNSIAD